MTCLLIVILQPRGLNLLLLGPLDLLFCYVGDLVLHSWRAGGLMMGRASGKVVLSSSGQVYPTLLRHLPQEFKMRAAVICQTNITYVNKIPGRLWCWRNFLHICGHCIISNLSLTSLFPGIFQEFEAQPENKHKKFFTAVHYLIQYEYIPDICLWLNYIISGKTTQEIMI